MEGRGIFKGNTHFATLLSSELKIGTFIGWETMLISNLQPLTDYQKME
jgi:hypothetical protein